MSLLRDFFLPDRRMTDGIFFVSFCYVISIFILIHLYGQFYTGVEG